MPEGAGIGRTQIAARRRIDLNTCLLVILPSDDIPVVDARLLQDLHIVESHGSAYMRWNAVIRAVLAVQIKTRGHDCIPIRLDDIVQRHELRRACHEIRKLAKLDIRDIRRPRSGLDGDG